MARTSKAASGGKTRTSAGDSSAEPEPEAAAPAEAAPVMEEPAAAAGSEVAAATEPEPEPVAPPPVTTESTEPAEAKAAKSPKSPTTPKSPKKEKVKTTASPSPRPRCPPAPIARARPCHGPSEPDLSTLRAVRRHAHQAASSAPLAIVAKPEMDETRWMNPAARRPRRARRTVDLSTLPGYPEWTVDVLDVLSARSGGSRRESHIDMILGMWSHAARRSIECERIECPTRGASAARGTRCRARSSTSSTARSSATR